MLGGVDCRGLNLSDDNLEGASAMWGSGGAGRDRYKPLRSAPFSNRSNSLLHQSNSPPLNPLQTIVFLNNELRRSQKSPRDPLQ